MVRKLALAVSLALGTLSVPVHALGLGELNSRSTLNQNFDGDISLLSVLPEELDGVRVKLADAQAFERAGVERPFYLSLLKFEPTLSGKGKPVIRVTSEFPIREPFMDFLVEVNWPNGRLLREYTVLLDPPTTTLRRPPAVAPVAKSSKPAAAPAAPAVPKTAKPSAAPVMAASVSADGSEYGPVKANETAWSIAKQLRQRGVSMEQMMMALLNANPQAFVDNNINRLRKGQILRVPAVSEIQKLSREEARQAYREQQDQWLARRNQQLQSAAEAEGGTEAEAGSATAGDAGNAGAAESRDQLRIATARPEGSGEAGAGDDDALTATASDIKSRLIVARENAETSRQEAEVLRTQVDDLEARLADMQKLLSLKDDQLAQLQDRVLTGEPEGAEVPAEGEVPEAAMADQAPVVSEEVVVQAEAATDAVSDVMADAVQAGSAVVGDYRIEDIPPQVDPDRIVNAGGVIEPAGGMTPPETGTLGIQDIPPQIDPDRIVLMAGAEPVAEIPAAVDEIVIGGAMDQAAPAEGEVVVIEGAVDSPLVEPAAVEAPSVVTELAPAAVEAVEPPVADGEGESSGSSPLAAMVEQNIVPIAVGGVVVLGLFGWLATRGRRKDQAPEPALAGLAAGAATAAVEPPEAAPVDEPAVDAAALTDLPDSAFLDEFSPSDINALQDETGEVDPVSEADVYIAYGRYQQAEELLRQAMSREPDRLALKHKLLEVHYATRNGDAFGALAQEMVDAGQDTADENAWARARDMGRELSPENPLFAAKEGEVVVAAAAAATAGAAAAAGVDDDTLSLDDLELSELTADFDEDKDASKDLEAPSEVSIMLDLEEASELTESVAPDLPDAIGLDEIDSMDFELPEAETSSASPTGRADDEVIGDTLDLDTMMADAEAAIDADDSTLSLDSEFSADELQAQLDELSDLSVLDSELDEPPGAPTAEPPGGLGLKEADSGIAAATLDQPLSLDTAFDAADGEDAELETLELEDVGFGAEPVGEDEVTTKLDLARAYVDMGDEDGARSILDEVVVEGNEVQRGDAEKLLARLG